MNIIKPIIRIASVALAMLTAGILQAADAAQEWQKGPSDAWFVKWDEAAAEAKKTGKPIFVLKTGSDWCGWCIRLRKNVLSKPEFEAFAKKNLVLLYLDSPSKTPLCAEQKKHNEEVSRKLSLGGGVPNASVVTADCKKLGSISGGGLDLDAYLGKLKELLGKGSAKANEKTVAPEAAQGHNMKLPYALMPKDGRTADFDFDGEEPVSKVKTEVEISGVHMTMEDGCLDFDGVYHNEWEKDIVFNGLNLDGFTLAMSVFPRNWRKCSDFMYKYQLLSIGAEAWRSNALRFSFANSGTIVPGGVVSSNEWSYFVVSFDAVKKSVSFVINGKYYAPRALPADFAWPVAPGDSEREMKSVMFGNASCGRRFDGRIDDFMVYDRPLTAVEMKKIAGLQQTPPVVVDKKTLARKLPQTSMPRDGRVADFDFDGDEPEDKSGSSATVSGENKEMSGGRLVFDGNYDGVSKGEVYVPGIDFDHFTVAMSFMLKAWPRGFGQMFVIGRNCGNALEMKVGQKEVAFRLANSAEIKVDAPLKLDEWNWFVLSVDAVDKKVRYAINGQKGMPRPLPKSFAWTETGSDKPEARGFQFRDPGFGVRFKGEIDDFIVYDRALSMEEISRIVRRQPAPNVAQKTVKSKKDDGVDAKKGVAKTPVKPAPGAWMLKMGKVRSAYWNAEISRDGQSLTVHREGDELCVQPLANAGAEIDLTKPVMSEDGETFKIVGIGAARSFAGRVGGERIGKLTRVELPETLTMLHNGAFASSSIEQIDLPASVKEIGDSAFDGCINLKRITLPDGLRSIGGHAFYRCTALSSVVVPATVERIGGLAFMNCGSLLSVEVKGPTKLGERVFVGSTPVGGKLSAETVKGPFKLEAKRDASLAYALNGRMKEPFLNSLKFGTCIRFISGCGSIRFTRCPEIADRMDTSYHKVGPELVCGSSACWVITEDAEGTNIKSRRSLELASKMLSETFPKIKLNPVTWKNTEDWPQSVSGLDVYYGRQGLLYKAIEANDFSGCVASSRTEADGYRIDFRVWGSKASKTVFLSFDIVDTIMQRAWGVNK